jgi:hypothetical protein
MKPDDIIKMAREAGFEINSLGWTYTQGFLSEHLERFAALVAAHEREACAALCERFANRMMSAEECADAIRAGSGQ